MNASPTVAKAFLNAIEDMAAAVAAISRTGDPRTAQLQDAFDAFYAALADIDEPQARRLLTTGAAFLSS